MQKPKRVVCLRCHEVSDARWVAPVSSSVEGFVYFVSTPFLCIPAFFLSLFRSAFSRWTCGICASTEVVPVRSRRGRELVPQDTLVAAP